MFVVMAAAVTILMVVVLVLVLVLMFMVMAAAVTVLMMVMLVLHTGKLCRQSSLTLHSLYKLTACQLRPGSCNNSCMVIQLPEHRQSLVQLLLGNICGSGQNDSISSLNLIIVELAKVLHIHFHLTGIHHSNSISQGHLFIGDLIDSSDHIGQLAYTGGLDDNAIRVILLDDLCQGAAKVAYKAAANAAGIHFCNIDAGVLQEATIDADLTEFVFNQYQFLSTIALLDHFLDQGCLTCTKKAGIYIDLRHFSYTFCTKLFNLL